MPTLCFISFNLFFGNVSGFPNAYEAVFTAGHEVETFALVWVSTVDFNTTWYELNVRNEVLVRFFDRAHDKVLHLNWSLLTSFVFFFLFFDHVFPASFDPVLLGAKVPDYQLAINRTSNQDFWILWVELYTWDFNGSL